jgi:hypothetical protein
MEWCLLLKWNYLCISLLLITANRYMHHKTAECTWKAIMPKGSQ